MYELYKLPIVFSKYSNEFSFQNTIINTKYDRFLRMLVKHNNEKILRLLLHLKPNLHDMTRATDLSNDPYQTRIIQIKINLFWQINSFFPLYYEKHNMYEP